MAQRAASDIDGLVVAIGTDTGQTGDYGSGIGTWESFTFDTVPPLATGVADYMDSHMHTSSTIIYYKVSGGSVVARTLEELQAQYGS